MSGAMDSRRASQTSGLSFDGPSTRAVSVRPLKLAQFSREIFFCRAIRRLRRSLMVSASTLPSSGKLPALSTSEYSKTPIQSSFAGGDKIVKLLEVGFGFAGKADDEAGAQRDAGNGGAHPLEEFQEGVAVGAALHAGQDVAAGMLQRHVDVFGQAFVGGEGFEHFLRYAIWIGVEKAHPEQVFDLGEAFEELREAVAQVEVFAVGGCVLADQGDFASAGGGEIFRFADDGFESAAAEFAAKLRDDAEGAGVIAAFGDFDVGLVLRRGDDARRQVVIEKCRGLAREEFSGRLRRLR